MDLESKRSHSSVQFASSLHSWAIAATVALFIAGCGTQQGKQANERAAPKRPPESVATKSPIKTGPTPSPTINVAEVREQLQPERARSQIEEIANTLRRIPQDSPDFTESQALLQEAERWLERISSEEKRGEEVFHRLKARHPAVDIMTDWGRMTSNPGIAVFLPRREWARLSKADRIGLTRFMESEARGYGPCEGCWMIGVGDEVGVGDITLDKTVLAGDSFWEKDDPCCRGVKASEFRRDSTQGARPTQTTRLAEDSQGISSDGASCEQERRLCRQIGREFNRINRMPGPEVKRELECRHVRNVCENTVEAIRQLGPNFSPQVRQMYEACRPLLRGGVCGPTGK